MPSVQLPCGCGHRRLMHQSPAIHANDHLTDQQMGALLHAPAVQVPVRQSECVGTVRTRPPVAVDAAWRSMRNDQRKSGIQQFGLGAFARLTCLQASYAGEKGQPCRPRSGIAVTSSQNCRCIPAVMLGYGNADKFFINCRYGWSACKRVTRFQCWNSRKSANRSGRERSAR